MWFNRFMNADAMIAAAIAKGMSSRSARRFIVVRVHRDDASRADIVRRSDSFDVARKAAMSMASKSWAPFVIDSADGSKVYG